MLPFRACKHSRVPEGSTNGGERADGKKGQNQGRKQGEKIEESISELALQTRQEKDLNNYLTELPRTMMLSAGHTISSLQCGPHLDGSE